MKTKSYKKAVQWIAANDEPWLLNWWDMKDLISVVLVAHVFECDPKEVAKEVTMIRLYPGGSK